jgi:hypothetical protein
MKFDLLNHPYGTAAVCFVFILWMYVGGYRKWGCATIQEINQAANCRQAIETIGWKAVLDNR